MHLEFQPTLLSRSEPSEKYNIHSLINLSTLAVYPPASATIAQGLDTNRLEIITDSDLNVTSRRDFVRRTVSNDVKRFKFEPVQKWLELLGKFLVLFLFFL
jgi:hypothetical protein